jgi:phenylpyruvate tautomerase PptA (4-oxalocrotonate tautomerase family)
MPFVEVFSPPGTPRPEQRRRIADRLVAEVMAGEGAPDTEFARAISWLVWHDLEAMSVGGKAVSAGEPPRYVVRVTVPAASLTDAKREEIVRRVTRVLADADDDPDRFYNSPSSFVLLTEIPDGDWGGIGRIVRFSEIASFVLTGAPDAMSEADLNRLVRAGPTWEEANL